MTRRPRGRGRAALVATAILSLLAAATAHALPDVGETEDGAADTRLTPVAKKPPEDMWTQLGGATYDPEGPSPENLIEDSPTPFEASLLAVDFAAKDAGFAGGTIEKEDGSTEPVISSYSEPAGDGIWEEELRAQGDGYVAAITHLPGGRALAVGGDGDYPHREPAYSEEEKAFCQEGQPPPVDDDPAGRARAWLYEGGSWRELRQLRDGTPGDELPDEMGALTALDAYRNDGALRDTEFAVAGGLCRLWHWKDGGFLRESDGSFAEPFSPESPIEKLENAQNFAYRVQEVTFATYDPAKARHARPIRVYAATNGCCAPDRVNEVAKRAAVLEYVPGEGHPAEGSWRAPTDEQVPPPLSAKEVIPDSFYSLTATQTRSGFETGMVLSPAGRPVDGDAGGNEPPSMISYGYGGVQYPVGPRLNHWTAVSGARLVDGDGDIGGKQGTYSVGWGPGAAPSEATPPLLQDVGGDQPKDEPDGLPDWSIGELTSRGQAIALATDPGQLDQPDPLLETPPAADEITGYEPTNPNRAQASLRSYTLLELPTYRLNAIDYLDEDRVAFAVGEHGAIMRYAQDQSEIANRLEPQPPRLGAPKHAGLPDDSAYADTGGDSPQPGPLPALSARPRESLDDPEVRAAGSGGDQVSQIVMSRDGSEGWAIGNENGLTLLHYVNGAWRHCDGRGVPGQLAPDRACEALAPLFEQRVSLRAAARVPLERDSDPTNDDDFEVLAVGDGYRNPETESTEGAVIRYGEGVWSFESEAARGALSGVKDIAFTAPDEGWAIGGARKLFRYDGETWIECASAADRCDDAESRRLSGGQADWVAEGLSAAGGRVYVYGYRFVSAVVTNTGIGYPMIVYHERGRKGWHGALAEGGYDPAHLRTGSGTESPPAEEEGAVHSLAVAQLPDGTYEGWAAGRFGASGAGFTEGTRIDVRRPRSSLLRLAGGSWAPFRDTGALADYRGFPRTEPRDLTVGVDANGRPLAVLGHGFDLLAFDDERGRWQILPSSRPPDFRHITGSIQAVAPDGAGGAWAAVSNSSSTGGGTIFYRYSATPASPVLGEVANTVEEGRTITDLEGSDDGTLWLSTDSNLLYRYRRATGWNGVRIPGWDPGSVITRASRVNAVATGPGGEGFAVGEGGRIAEIGPEGVVLDMAAGKVCDLTAPVAPCGTAHDLVAADVAPDGSALAVGKGHALLWRPAGGEFRAVSPPELSRVIDFTAVSMPRPNRAWIATDNGLILAGRSSGGAWSWGAENRDGAGDPITVDRGGTARAIRGLELDAAGHGYAVGDRGTVLERTGDGAEPWHRVSTGFLDDLVSIDLQPGAGGIVGAKNGAVFSLSDWRLDIVRPPDFSGRAPTGPVVGVALLPGVADGQAEAWAAVADDGSGTRLNRLLHYSSDPDEALLDPSPAAPLPDAPPSRAGEITAAAFGKSECSYAIDEEMCADFTGSLEISQVVSERVREAVSARRPDIALFTGDAVDSATLPMSQAVREGPGSSVRPNVHDSHLTGPAKLRSWAHRIADGLGEAGVPLLGALGGQDLSETGACDDLNLVGGNCFSTGRTKSGDNRAWRQVMEGRPAPWGTGKEAQSGEYTLEPVADSAERGATGPQELSDVELGDPSGGTLGDKSVRHGQARTHYAADLVSPDGEPAARVVVADNSLRSLVASDPQQQPAEPQGQAAWLERVLCRAPDRAPTGERCTREEGQPAVVVANAPTYSYGPGALTETAQDMASFEAILLRHRVSAVVSGRIGWNGLYYALAPGLHSPCPGGDYPERAPRPGQAPDCTGDATSRATGTPNPELPSLEDATGLSGVLPFAIASGAGGKFSEEARGATASEGFWHGYTVVRISPDGDPRKTIVEQRPVYDWIGIQGARRMVRAREKLRLLGVGRGPIGVDFQANPNDRRASLDEIESPAVTHRFDLLLADPEEPWVPLRASDATPAQLSAAAEAKTAMPQASGASNPCDPYVCLDPEVGEIDDQTGQVRAGGGDYPLTFAAVMLSVGREAGTYPLAFEPSPSFRAEPPVAPRPSFGGASVAPPANPSVPSVPQIPSVSVPTPPVPPALVPPPPAPPASPPQPPVPPPVPPADAGPSPLSLSFAPTGLVVAPTASVIPPPAPPINPAPPGGARKEARQRQAATQKSGADSGSENASGGDLADGPPEDKGTASMTRLDSSYTRGARSRPEPSFTAYRPSADGTSWTTGALYGGGLAFTALALALGWTHGRPTPRPRTPELPAPALSTVRRGRR